MSVLVLEKALSLIFPETCQFCREQVAAFRDGYVCAQCWQRLRFVRHPFCDRCGLPYDGDIVSTFRCSNCEGQSLDFNAARAAVVANEFSLGLIHRYKYSGWLWLEKVLADLLWDQLGTLGVRSGWDLVVPVPLHRTKQREREFNQAERMGAIMADRMGVPFDRRVLKRVAPTDSQTMLSRSQRRKNVGRAFGVGCQRDLRGVRVMLVDDVLTTGATTSACSRVLRRLGAVEIMVATVVRGL